MKLCDVGNKGAGFSIGWLGTWYLPNTWKRWGVFYTRVRPIRLVASFDGKFGKYRAAHCHYRLSNQSTELRIGRDLPRLSFKPRLYGLELER